MLWWVDLKKVVAIIAVAVVAIVAFVAFLDLPKAHQTPPTATMQMPMQKGDYTAKLRIVGNKCIIRVDTPPVPYNIVWPWVHPNLTSPGAGGYYAYLLLINRSNIGVTPAIARAYNSTLYFVFKCRIEGGMLLFEAFPTFVNKTMGGFNEQFTVGVDFGNCAVDYCEFGWREWRFVAERVYVFLNWYYAPVNGYALPAIGGVPYEVVFSQ